MEKEKLPTKADLQELKKELKREIQKVKSSNAPFQEWIRGPELRKRLGDISPSTERKMRRKGLLIYTKFNNTYYYNWPKIVKKMENNERT